MEFYVGTEIATAQNGAIVKENPVYGDSWNDIVQLKEITVRMDETIDPDPQFILEVSGSPDAGEQDFTVLYSGTIGGTVFEDKVVFTGSVNVARRTVTVEAGTYQVSKEYDGGTGPGIGEGELAVTGILERDTGVSVTAEPQEYNYPDVGAQDTVDVSLALAGEGSGNYQLAEAVIQVPCEITPKKITPEIKIYGSWTYTGNPVIPTLTVFYNTDGQQAGTLDKNSYTAEYFDNIDAGTARVSVTPAEGGNFTWDSPAEEEFTIGKAYHGNVAASISVKRGNRMEYDIASFLPEGSRLGNPSAPMDPDGILPNGVTLTGTVIAGTLANDSKKVGAEAQLLISVVETKNYRYFDIVITVHMLDKTAQNLAFQSDALDKTYGDEPFVNTLTGAAEGSAVTYTSSDPSVAVVNSDGRVQILKEGDTQITAAAAETDEYAEAVLSYALHVNPAMLSWDVSDLAALDREGNIQENTASLSGSLKVSGILERDKDQVSFTCPADSLTGVYASTEPGDTKVALSWAGEPVLLQGEKASCYVLPAALPEITGTIHQVITDLPAVPESTENQQYRLEMEIGISEVPDAFPDLEHLNTPGKIETQMRLAVQQVAGGVDGASTAVYDIRLWVNIGGTGWVLATADNFPAGGITVTLPYPAGTGSSTHDFFVTHMATMDVNGMKAGEMEYPAVTKTEAGIQFRVLSLSPVAVAWKEIPQTPETDDGKETIPESESSTESDESERPEDKKDKDKNKKDNDGKGSDSENGGNADTNGGSQTDASSGKPEAAATGDSSPVEFYMALLAVSAAGISVLLTAGKRRQDP